jgi:hypothetical protein
LDSLCAAAADTGGSFGTREGPSQVSAGMFGRTGLAALRTGAEGKAEV